MATEVTIVLAVEEGAAAVPMGDSTWEVVVEWAPDLNPEVVLKVVLDLKLVEAQKLLKDLELAEYTREEFGNHFHSNIVQKNMSRNPLEDCLRYLAVLHNHRLHCSN